MGKIEKLPVSALTRDLNLQPRERIDDATVASYAEDIAAGAKMPPVVVFDDGSKRYWLADGFHRCEAALKAIGEGAEVEVDLRKGDGDAAFLFSLGANAEHGLRRTNKDIKRAVERCLARFSGYTDRQVAKVCKVSHHTVKAHRPPPAVGQLAQLNETRTGADGKQYKAKKPKADKPKAPPVRAVKDRAAADAYYAAEAQAAGLGEESQDVPDVEGPAVRVIESPPVEEKPPQPFAPVLFGDKPDDGAPAFNVAVESDRARALFRGMFLEWPKAHWPRLCEAFDDAQTEAQ